MWQRAQVANLRYRALLPIDANVSYHQVNCSGGAWESNPPRTGVARPADGFEDREAHRDPSASTCQSSSPARAAKSQSVQALASPRRRVGDSAWSRRFSLPLCFCLQALAQVMYVAVSPYSAPERHVLAAFYLTGCSSVRYLKKWTSRRPQDPTLSLLWKEVCSAFPLVDANLDGACATVAI